MNRVKPAHVPGCFKMFKTTGTHREQPGRLSNTVINREDAGSILLHIHRQWKVTPDAFKPRRKKTGLLLLICHATELRGY